ARKSIAKQLNAQASEIIFTSGGTEADNLAIHCAVRDLGVERIITSPVEHHAVLHAAEFAAKHFGAELKLLPVHNCGTPDIEILERLLKESDKKTLVSLMHVNNEVGTLIDVKKIAELVKSYGAYFHCDMVQSIGHFPINFSEIPVDFAAASAHKFHGPKGVGFAFIRKGSKVHSLIHGGGQERGLRAGTESVHNIVGMHKAFELAYEHLDEEMHYVNELKQYFKLKAKETLPNLGYNGACADDSKSTYNLLNVSIPCSPEKAMMLLFNLDLKGIACSKGSACQSGADTGSHVIQAIRPVSKPNEQNIRFSFSTFNTKEEIDYVLDILSTITQ
ncbi:MAG: cysteine desulfurase family protein, partial [Flavobacteriaceae bacterium]|nr:cysteine desulfurase family protein [Flavobacteriaceae bacterium]